MSRVCAALTTVPPLMPQPRGRWNNLGIVIVGNPAQLAKSVRAETANFALPRVPNPNGKKATTVRPGMRCNLTVNT